MDPLFECVGSDRWRSCRYSGMAFSSRNLGKVAENDHRGLRPGIRRFRRSIRPTFFIALTLALGVCMVGCSSGPTAKLLTTRNAIGSGVGYDTSPQVPECMQSFQVSQQPQASACIFWYNETAQSLTFSQTCAHGHFDRTPLIGPPAT
jgi:hypothetical protein